MCILRLMHSAFIKYHIRETGSSLYFPFSMEVKLLQGTLRTSLADLTHVEGLH